MFYIVLRKKGFSHLSGIVGMEFWITIEEKGFEEESL